MHNFQDLTGQEHGILTVVARAADKGKHTAWKCICECGNVKIYDAYRLSKDIVSSCGCLNRLRPAKFINLCNAIYDEQLLLKAFHWYIDGKYSERQRNASSVFLRGYPCVSINGKQVNIHVLLMMYKLNTKNLNGYIVHHEDDNILNADMGNLQLITRSQHNSIHHKNKIVSKATREKLKTVRTSKGKKHRNDILGVDVYEMRIKGMFWSDIANIYGVHKDTVRDRYNKYMEKHPD